VKTNTDTKRRSKLKILFPYVGGDDFGGSHISSLILVDLLKQTDVYEPIIGVHKPGGRLAEYLEDNHFSYENFPFPNLIEPRHKRSGSAFKSLSNYAFKTLPKMRSYLNDNGIDIVHTNDGRMHLNWGLSCKVSRSKMVWHHRGDPTAKGANYFAPLLANQIITVSKFAKPKNPVRNIDHKWSVVHSPFHTFANHKRDDAKKELLNELDLPKGTVVLGYFGELIGRKRPVVFAEIIAAFTKKYPDVPCVGVVLGAVPPRAPALDQDMLARATELGVSDKVKYLGFRSPIEPYIAATDVLLVPALSEPFGRTLIEAMHLGTAVVATDHGGNPEAIVDGETGFLVPHWQPEAFADPIHRLVTDAELFEDITRKAKSFVQKRLTLETHFKGVTSVYGALGSKS
jgi:glycosyltransferase involved in cell wall biosynthesis